jgi:transposase-like protein
LELLLEERVALEAIATNTTLPHRAVREAKGLLMAADGVANSVIGELVGVSRSTVLGWRRDLIEHGIDWVGKV